MSKVGLHPGNAFKEAKALYKANQAEKAKALCLRIVQQYPLHQDANYFLAKLAFEGGLNEESLLFCKKRFQVRSNSTQISMLIIRFLIGIYRVVHLNSLKLPVCG
jgi:hypothetical protein